MRQGRWCGWVLLLVQPKTTTLPTPNHARAIPFTSPVTEKPNMREIVGQANATVVAGKPGRLPECMAIPSPVPALWLLAIGAFWSYFFFFSIIAPWPPFFSQGSEDATVALA